MIRQRLGLEPSQKADLLREVTALASWVVRQVERGRTVEARRGKEVEPLVHPAIERLRTKKEKPVGERLVLRDVEVARLATVLDRSFVPPAALRKALANLAKARRRPPKLRWKTTAA